MNGYPDTPWICLSCGEPIDDENGVSLSDDTVYQICEECFGNLTTWQRMELVRRWRKTEIEMQAWQSVGDLCRAGLASTIIGGLARPGRN